MNKQAIIILAVAVGAMLLIFDLGSRWYKTQRTDEIVETTMENPATLVPRHAMTLGSEDARVTIVEFFDPACETCAAFAAPVDQLMRTHSGRIRLVLRYAPFHEGSEEIVKILEATRKQNKYWETRSLLFSTQSLWASHHDPRPELVWELLPQAGVDVEQVRADILSPELDLIIQQDLADAEALGVRKTPSYFVNGRPLPSFGLRQLRELVESEITAKY